jgi:hypothetical protein
MGEPGQCPVGRHGSAARPCVCMHVWVVVGYWPGTVCPGCLHPPLAESYSWRALGLRVWKVESWQQTLEQSVSQLHWHVELRASCLLGRWHLSLHRPIFALFTSASPVAGITGLNHLAQLIA